MKKAHLSRHYGEPGGQAFPEKTTPNFKSLRRKTEKNLTGGRKNDALRNKMN